ncbi:hypothetical protein VP1G_10700 [Cytospora mali]|uniref:Uncharacterized protein n=1 Tax=Cytospora mali TaxID=578113 RepID=A0A194USI0_CYTMA|nr:hypothetical protein VP1G_10700 [Valsa mali var. pyri (nom. inval.)]
MQTNAVSGSKVLGVGVDDGGSISGDAGAVTGVALQADRHTVHGKARILGNDARSVGTRSAAVALVLGIPLDPSHTDGTEEAVNAAILAHLVPDKAVLVGGATDELDSVVVLGGKVRVGQRHDVAPIVVIVTGVASVEDLGSGGALPQGGGRAVVREGGELGHTGAAGAGARAGRIRGGGGSGGRADGGGGGGKSCGEGGGEGGCGGSNRGNSLGGLVGDDGGSFGSGGSTVVLGLGPRNFDAVDDGGDHIADVTVLNLALLVVEAGVGRWVGRNTNSSEKEKGGKTGHF